MCHGMRSRRGGPSPGALLLCVHLSLSLGPAHPTPGFLDFDVCADPRVPEHGYRTPSAGLFFENAVARFHCLEGHRLQGPAKKQCTRHYNGSLGWKPSGNVACLQEVSDCLIPHVQDADIHNKTYKPGSRLIISCHEGFQTRYPDLDSMASTCQDDGSWDNLPVCQGCLRPLVLPHSFINISEFKSSFPVGRVVYYQCFPGYKLEGAEFVECMYNLIWSDSPPKCLDVEELAWPNAQETLLTTWKILAFTASSVLLVLLLVIIAKIFQSKFKTYFRPRGTLDSPVDPDFVVVDGVPVMLPSYDEAVSSDLHALASGHMSSAGQGPPPRADDQNPPAYPGNLDTDLLPGEAQICQDSLGSSELLQDLLFSSGCHQEPAPSSGRTGLIPGIENSVPTAASTSPSIDIADEIPLMDEDP